MSAVRLLGAREKDRTLFRNVFNMYQNELSQYTDEYPELDENGYFEADAVDVYFNGDPAIFPYIVTDGRRIAGVLILSGPPYVKSGCDYCIQEFFLIGSCRGKGVADAALGELFRLHPGNYCLIVLNRNLRAMRFWERICAGMPGSWTRTEREQETVFTFQTE